MPGRAVGTAGDAVVIGAGPDAAVLSASHADETVGFDQRGAGGVLYTDIIGGADGFDIEAADVGDLDISAGMQLAKIATGAALIGDGVGRANGIDAGERDAADIHVALDEQIIFLPLFGMDIDSAADIETVMEMDDITARWPRRA